MGDRRKSERRTEERERERRERREKTGDEKKQVCRAWEWESVKRRGNRGASRGLGRWRRRNVTGVACVSRHLIIGEQRRSVVVRVVCFVLGTSQQRTRCLPSRETRALTLRWACAKSIERTKKASSLRFRS